MSQSEGEELISDIWYLLFLNRDEIKGKIKFEVIIFNEYKQYSNAPMSKDVDHSIFINLKGQDLNLDRNLKKQDHK